MRPDTKAMIFEEGGKLASGLLRLVITRPRKHSLPEEEIQSPTKVAYIEPPIETTMSEPMSISVPQVRTEHDELDYRWECCVVPGTAVITNPTLKAIEKLLPGDNVLTHKGNFAAISKIMSRHYTGDIYGIRTKYFNLDTYLTTEHPIYAIKTHTCPHKWRKFCAPCSCGWKCEHYYQQYKPDWITPDKLQMHDMVVLPYPKTISDITDIDDIPLNGNLLDLIGLYLAEGSADGNRVVWSYGKSEELLILETQRLVRLVFGVVPKVRDTTTATNVYICSQQLSNWFSSHFGDHSWSKKLPQEFMYLPTNKQARILYRHWSGDGNRNHNCIGYTTVSETLALQIRMILLRLQIISSLTIVPADKIKPSLVDGRYIIAKHTAYRIDINGKSARDICLMWDIPLIDGYEKQSQLGYISNGYLLIPITKITKKYYDGEVHNCSVPGDESYTLTNFTVHNCMKHLGGASILLREAYERVIDEGIGEGTAEKIMEAMNEHSGMESDLEKMLSMPEAKEQAEKLLSGVRAFRRAAWEAKLPTGSGTKEDVADARLWNDILYQETFANAKQQPGQECTRQGM